MKSTKFVPSKNTIYLSIIALLTCLLLLSNSSTITHADPGSANDPLVTQRYVDARIQDLQAQINALQGGGSGGGITAAERTAIINDVRNSVLQSIGPGLVVPFTPLFVPAGSVLIADAGVEFILRGGRAYVIAGPNGIVDATAGRDIANGQRVSSNHLMLVPATDGRGLSFASDSWLMIKGGFTIAN